MYIILPTVVQSVAGGLDNVTKAMEPTGEVPEIRWQEKMFRILASGGGLCRSQEKKCCTYIPTDLFRTFTMLGPI